MIGIPELEQPNTATPGPWEAKDDCTVISVHEEMDEVICSCAGRKIDAAFFSDVPGRGEANARLIAAAPEMLAALQMIARGFERVGVWYCSTPSADAVKAAIAKATGANNA